MFGFYGLGCLGSAREVAALAERSDSCRQAAPKLVACLEENAPESFAVFSLPEHHRRRLRTSNWMERAVQQESKRRTSKGGMFPNEDSLEPLVSAVLVEVDDK